MRYRGLGIGELCRGVRIAVEGEEAARFQRASGQGVIEVLSRRIAIDLNRHAALYRCRKHSVPISNHAGARPSDPTARVGQLAPNFRLPKLQGGTVSLADFRGKRVLIESWASW